VEARPDAAQRGGGKVGHVGLDRHEPEVRHREKLGFGHPLQVFVRFLVLSFLAPFRIGFDHADHLVVVLQLEERLHLGRAVVVADAELADLDTSLGFGRRGCIAAADTRQGGDRCG